ncbi:hypothetical protein [Burkholderia sp. MSMB1835]|uniref:hypothetical protein n=1 Tax=Burkholderia sp. MSMB1835 TaxID=1637876 RepID=UPI0015D09836|nr:hypothetical protein [Burkholderia sp. MSMB1835]
MLRPLDCRAHFAFERRERLGCRQRASQRRCRSRPFVDDPRGATRNVAAFVGGALRDVA